MSPVRLPALCLFLFTVVLFSPVQNFDFINFDDPAYVSENSMVRRGLTQEGVAWAFGHLHGEQTYWHPLTWLSLMVDCSVFGPQPGALHLINVLLHAVAAVLVFHVLHEMTRCLWRSALVAALFAWHPLQVEGVVWIAERKNVLAAVFWALTLLFYHRYASSRSRGYYALTVLVFALGLMCKPVLITLPCVLLLLDYWPLQRFGWPRGKKSGKAGVVPAVGFGRAVLEKVTLLGLSLVSAGITLVGHQRLGTTISADEMPFSFRLANAVVSYGRYLFKTVWPAKLSVYYPMPPEWPTWLIALSAAVLLAVTVAAVKMRRSKPYLIVGWLWFLGVLVPMIGLVQASTQSMADRFAYFSLIGLFISVVWWVADGLGRFHAPRWLAPTLTVLVLSACCVTAGRQIRYWKNSLALFSHALAVTQDNAVAQNNFGSALEKAGRTEEAARHYREAIRIKPKAPQPYNNLGNALDELGRLDEAATAYQQALALRPNAALVHNNLAITLARRGRFNEARVHLLRAMELKPREAHSHYLMGTVHVREGNARAAVSAFRTALEMNPQHLKALVFLSRLLAANEDDSIRNGAEAVRLAEQAVALSTSDLPETIEMLAMAYAEAGRLEHAIKLQSQAVEQWRAARAPSSELSEASKRLALYQAGRPYRESATNIFVSRPVATP